MASHDTNHEPPLQAYLELVRLPNLFTAMADVAMGVLFVQAVATRADLLRLASLACASALLYAAGVVLNDVVDLKVDARQRPGRPLPSGRVSPQMARWLAVQLLLAGAAVAWLVSFLLGHLGPGVVATALVGCILAYDLLLKRTPLGPVAMGGCRMLNVMLGMSVAAGPWQTDIWHTGHWLVASAVGVYITGITWFARTEATYSNRLSLTLAAGVMLGGIAMLASLPRAMAGLPPGFRVDPQRWQLLMGVLGALIGWRFLRAIVEPAAPRVQVAVKQGILSLVILDAAVCYATRGMQPAVAVLLLLLPATMLGRRIAST